MHSPTCTPRSAWPSSSGWKKDLLAGRRTVAARYAEVLGSTPGLTFCAQAPWAHSNFWLMSVLVDAEYPRSREELFACLRESGIQSRPFFTPLPDVEAYRDARHTDVPVARRLHAQGLSLPSSASLTAADQDRVLAELLSL